MSIDVKKHVTARVTGTEYKNDQEIRVLAAIEEGWLADVVAERIHINPESKMMDRRLVIDEPRTREDQIHSGIQVDPNAAARTVEGLAAVMANPAPHSDTVVHAADENSSNFPFHGGMVLRKPEATVNAFDDQPPAEEQVADYENLFKGFADGGIVENEPVYLVGERVEGQFVPAAVAQKLTAPEEISKLDIDKVEVYNVNSLSDLGLTAAHEAAARHFKFNHYTVSKSSDAMVLTDEELSILHTLVNRQIKRLIELELREVVNMDGLYSLLSKARAMFVDRGIWS